MENRKSGSIEAYFALDKKSEEWHEYYLENLTESTHKFDMADQFIQYQKLETLQYYFLAEPEKQLLIVHNKTTGNDWQINTYTSLTDVIDLPPLQISIVLKDIYPV